MRGLSNSLSELCRTQEGHRINFVPFGFPLLIFAQRAMLAKAGTLSFLASVSAVNVDVSSCVGFTVEPDNNYRFIHEDDSSVTIQILNVFSTDPQVKCLDVLFIFLV